VAEDGIWGLGLRRLELDDGHGRCLLVQLQAQAGVFLLFQRCDVSSLLCVQQDPGLGHSLGSATPRQWHVTRRPVSPGNWPSNLHGHGKAQRLYLPYGNQSRLYPADATHLPEITAPHLG
jgi:hypothetical protein